MGRRVLSAAGVLFLLAAVLAVAAQGPGSEPPRLTTDQLNAKLGDPEIAVVDVRAEGDWKGSDRKIAGAVREDPDDVAGWAGNYSRDKVLVLYCA